MQVAQQGILHTDLALTITVLLQITACIITFDIDIPSSWHCHCSTQKFTSVGLSVLKKRHNEGQYVCTHFQINFQCGTIQQIDGYIFPKSRPQNETALLFYG